LAADHADPDALSLAMREPMMTSAIFVLVIDGQLGASHDVGVKAGIEAQRPPRDRQIGTRSLADTIWMGNGRTLGDLSQGWS
jgi:hypothetical protein